MLRSALALLVVLVAGSTDLHHSHEAHVHVHTHGTNATAHHASAAAVGTTPLPPSPPPLIPVLNRNASADEAQLPSYAYEDDTSAADDGSDDAGGRASQQEKEAVEQHLWAELDIDEDRDEPIFKIVVVIITLGVVAYFVRTYWCTRCLRHHDSFSRGLYSTAGLENAADDWPPRPSRDS